ncbi:Uncharacterised protein [Mycobacteroides abscessus subsp. massiliense]|nr:Uncharacterised protein [Mycobacteroides abscessus subsp. massiliense]
MDGVHRRPDGDDGTHTGGVPRGREHRGPTEGMPDENVGRGAALGHECACRNNVIRFYGE